MQHIDFWFDVISPYAHLAFHKLPSALQGLSVGVRYRPVLFAGLLKHHGQLGPAEIAPKKLWTFQQVNWLAREQGALLQPPAMHPFNPLPLLRLLLALGPGDGSCNRYQAEQAFAHVWQADGQDAGDPLRLHGLAQRLLQEAGREAEDWNAQALLTDASAKDQLKLNGEQALAHGLFGVPSIVMGSDVFWGLDSLPMLRAKLLGDPWFGTPSWQRAAPARGLART